MKAALLCLLLVASTQVCRAYPTFGFGLPGLGGGHDVEKSVGDKVSHGSDCDDDERGPGGHGGPSGSPLPSGPSVPGLPGGPSVPGLPGGPSVPGLPGGPSVPGLPGGPSVPGVPGLPGSAPGGVPCADGLPAVPPPGPAGSIDSAVNTVEDTAHHGGNAIKNAARFNIHGTSQEILNGSDRAAIGGADIMNRFIPGSGTAALTAYAVPSGIAHLSAAGVSGAAILASGGILGPKPC